MDRRSRYRPSNTLHSLQSEGNRLFEDLFPGREGNGSRSEMEQMMWAPQKLFGGRSVAYDFVDLVQNGFCTRPVVPLQGFI
jgi:hypothetical protein